MYAIGACAAGGLASTVDAQTAIADWSIMVSDASNYTDQANGLNYRNTTYAITSFSTGSTSYGLSSTIASAVYVRRNTDSSGNGSSNQSGIDNNNRSSVWNTQYDDTDRLLGTYQTSLNGVLLNNNAVMGADNVFANSSDASRKSAGNIERLDFYFGATTVNAREGLTIFDRGLAGEHDSVKIAVFTSWNGANGGSPLSYSGNVVTLGASSYGNNLDWNPNQAGVQDSMTYTLLRFNNGDNLTALDEAIETNTQGVAGSFISFADLGIASGTTIYGYSIMGSDVTTSVSNLADWRNATYYPTGTTDDNGGIDLMSFNGRIARPVPEPSTYGALLLGGCVGVWFFRRRSLSAQTQRV
ncbi:PEP-CTERM sorting domain-containing protein [Nibricoccus aquaticus]|nr:PEP-CTERM sorting domain-containing protein [Nibricoccus aquaticus]